jgi:hypothetical protein
LAIPQGVYNDLKRLPCYELHYDVPSSALEHLPTSECPFAYVLILKQNKLTWKKKLIFYVRSAKLGGGTPEIR